MMAEEGILLITGFEPFGGERINPSWEAVKHLPDKVGNFRLVKLELPVAFGKAAELAISAADKAGADAVICVGQAGGREAVTPEVIGINLREASIADNDGNKPQNMPVKAGGQTAYFSTLPIREMVEAIKKAGIPAKLSYSAGAYVCNDLLYSVLDRFYGTSIRAGFIHVPFLPEQAKKGKPSLTLEQMTAALAAAINVL